MTMNTESMQNYWFPGHANQRAIFDFTEGVLNIELPGFPLVPTDSNNFGNVITLPGGVGYYIIGKYLVDSGFTPVAGAEGIFDNLDTSIANCAFAPDTTAGSDAHLYFIDSTGLHYGHITRSVSQNSSLDTLSQVSLTLPPISRSPLCIQGNASDDTQWLYYLSLQDSLMRLVVVCVKGGTELSSCGVTLPGSGVPVSIEICKNHIALTCDDASLVYGSLSASGEVMIINLEDSVSGLSPDCVQCAFSADGNTLFWLTKQAGRCYVNYKSLVTTMLNSSAVSGNYIALKCGPDQIVYGLSHLTLSSPTLLTVTPTGQADAFSVAEILVSTNGGYFPATGWNVYSV